MNQEWAEEKLELWLNRAVELDGMSVSDRNPRRRELLNLVQETHSQALRIVSALLATAPTTLIRNSPVSNDVIVVGDGIYAVRLALGVLRTDAETTKNLGSTAPKMQADNLHTVVWESAAGLWNDGHFAQAVQRAATFLNAHVQDLVGRSDISDATLMQETFSARDPQPRRSRLRWPGNTDDLTAKSMNEGLRGYAPGCFMAIRNVATHSRDEITQQDGLERLAALSLLARWIDQCELIDFEEGDGASVEV